MWSISKVAGSSGGETGIYLHSAAAAWSLLNKLCMQHGIFQKSLPGQLLAFHLHLLATFLTFHLLQALGVGRCLFQSKAGRQGAHSCGEGTQTLPLGCWRPSLLPISVSGLLCTEGSMLRICFSCTVTLTSLSTTTVPQATATSCPCQRDSYARSTKGICQSLACKQFINIKQFLDLKCLKR